MKKNLINFNKTIVLGLCFVSVLALSLCFFGNNLTGFANPVDETIYDNFYAETQQPDSQYAYGNNLQNTQKNNLNQQPFCKANEDIEDGFYITINDKRKTFTDDVVEIENCGNITIENINKYKATNKRIVIKDAKADSYKASITLNGVIINTKNGPAIEFACTRYYETELKLVNQNYLATTCSGCAGIQKNDNLGVLLVSGQHPTSEDKTTPNLTVKGGDYGAGIGGSQYGVTGNITLDVDCRINTYGGFGAAGIGSGYMGIANKIIIISLAKNSFVNAHGGLGAAGIGSGYCGKITYILLNTKKVTAFGGDKLNEYESSGGAGIGAGAYGSAKEIQLVSGDINAIAKYACAIGGGEGSSVDSIHICGGAINAIADNRAGGIGPSNATNVKITGGSLYANGIKCHLKGKNGLEAHEIRLDNPESLTVHVGSLSAAEYKPCNHTAIKGNGDTHLYMYQEGNEGDEIKIYIGEKPYNYKLQFGKWVPVENNNENNDIISLQNKNTNILSNNLTTSVIKESDAVKS